ncbi:hypothetical protein E1963_19215, partial [Extibacter muris]
MRLRQRRGEERRGERKRKRGKGRGGGKGREKGEERKKEEEGERKGKRGDRDLAVFLDIIIYERLPGGGRKGEKKVGKRGEGG